ncbi:uncharacterized protein F5Z01DRAFT_466518 [Emericellopsis atlantica]|uniref:Uncharacterized protein n=1 Tax=Emericellopsis atlantica TaxID=2614577 RepID=A0A9P7ZDX3_9HYPO|nr:uncharacterized protein F5Z01DRAFT_466518 [Emericellopsis atlantica]KAG9249785.1 hypothetical protein F5Z01DRAFT_466518 [Emericellopsis atlantica]
MPRVPSNGSVMERLREDLLRRARQEQEVELEEGHQRQPTPMSSAEESRPDLWCRFNDWRRMGRRAGQQTSDQAEDAVEVAGSPKPTARSVGFQALQTSRSALPRLAQLWSRQPPHTATQTTPRVDDRPSQAEPSGPPEALAQMPTPPEPVMRAARERTTSSEYAAAERPDSIGQPGNEEEQEARRRRREKRRRRRGLGGNPRKQKHSAGRSRRFLGCFPRVKSRQMRAYIVRCFVSGLFLVLLLTIYLSLSVSNSISMGSSLIVLILIVILATLFFCYGLIKLCLLVVRRDRAKHARALSLEENEQTAGFAIPASPIPVLLSRDEEVAGLEGEDSRPTPPAYGVWRESVRVDPNRLFWQRNADVESASTERPETRASRRPPSYSSDDGVSYVVDAIPRSTTTSSMSAVLASQSESGPSDRQRPAQ